MFPRLNDLLVIRIWATTPLAIKLGGDSLAPMAGLTLRMALAFAVGSLICTVFGLAGLNIRSHWRLYLAASISLFPNMVLVYQAAEYIPSGLMALMFGLNPLVTAVLAKPILGENLLRPRKVLAIVLAVMGLLCILADDVALPPDAALGIGLMLTSNLLFSGSALWVKRLNAQLTVEPLEQALGAMAFSLPGLVLTWVFVVGVEPLVISPTSLASLLYLALVASLVGFVAYYFILKTMSVEVVSLIPFVSPILAIVIGVLVADESLSANILVGAGLILSSLLLHQGKLRLSRNTASRADESVRQGGKA